MSRKKRTELGDDGEHPNGRSPSPAAPSLSPSPSQPLAATKKSSKPKVAPQPPPSQQVLVICRNKHWRYISSFHGPWLQLPPEILETIANANYNTPRPRPIDPAVFFDLVKIRRLVDEATNLSVRAASGVASIGQRGLAGASHHAAALGFGFGSRPPPQTKLSAERKHRMREQATQKLMEAYWLDEIASSVATMQSASSLEEVASLVLQRNPHDSDAKYVHFFHEKIPSRQLAECTSLTPINEIIAARPSNPEPLRTRAMVRVFKGDCQGAVDDLTEALKLYRLYRPAHASPKPPQESQFSERQPRTAGRRQEDVIPKPEDQPSSLEMQLLFQRAGIYLAIACRHVAAALPVDSAPANGHPAGCTQNDDAARQPEPESSPAEEEAQMRVAEARKLVRLNAKRALRDYTAYLSHFEYSPDLPIEIAEDFTRKVNSAINGARAPRSHSYSSGPRLPLAGEEEPTTAPHRVYALSDLFTSSPPTGLPPYPSTEVVPVTCSPPSPGSVQTTTETLTCHPLLTDTLHALLLCHSLIQTSAKELLRHANMVARLARLADGYPVFQSSRCPARADWIEVLRAGGNWIQLAGSWEDLCAPAPLPLFQSTGNGASPVPVSAPQPGQPKALAPPGTDNALTRQESPTRAIARDKQRIDRIHQQAVFDALSDDRIADESTLRLAIHARQLRAENDYRLENAVTALDAKLIRGEVGGEAVGYPSRGSLPTPDASPTTSIGTITETAVADKDDNSSPTTPATKHAEPPMPAPAPVPAQAAASTNTNGNNANPKLQRRATPSSAFDDGRDYYPISSERASAIARWVTQAPPPSSSTGTGAGDGGLRKRRKKPIKKATAAAADADGGDAPANGILEGAVNGGSEADMTGEREDGASATGMA